ncbi:MarC family protein [Dichelobacter nodosus]|uniref:UPF0056 inner membrane protein n=1 Tax=Dichelobacter nodosus (strain VCS1703A) TaxID=246195 RepID=A5EYD2_DICNV|nr:MarC family protein [Dichelobacter nodosus]ABQ13405.1 MarC family membrane protein [Dichelobacter nodosus VCS1703A]AXM45652.1 NAAT family transporter [Dichelobacter nodosus]KNZ38993.1 membrane protein [Dichelobacter nodosus]TGA66888.1 NAAT family transporter [Dichelobacter nodosus]
MSLTAAILTLFLIINPLGNVPVFLSILKNLSPKRQRIVLLRELCIAYAIMVVFLFGGSSILHGLNISREAVSISGAIVLFIIALRMIFPLRSGSVMGADDTEGEEEPLIVPIAIPFVAGPSLLATLIMMVESDPSLTTRWFFAMTISWFISLLIFLCAPFFFKILRKRGLKAVERLMGMILISISVQMMLNVYMALQATGA